MEYACGAGRMNGLLKGLLDQWCDGLLGTQVHLPQHPSLHGGLLCPACFHMHGRSGEGIFPLLYQSKITGESRYAEGAMALWEWSKQVDADDGAVLNDRNTHWKGITVFSALSLGETLLHCRDVIPEGTYPQMLARFRRMADFLLSGILDDPGAVVNYQMAGIAALALANRITGDKRYAEAAASRVDYCLSFITEDGLLTGESGTHPKERTKRGCGGVDVCYSVEESIPALAYYAHLAGDTRCYEAATALYQQLLPCLLPDGGWDNSFGVRNDKWTYWGSRTSDGCQLGLLLLSGADARFKDAAKRNLKLLARSTQEGLLYGGLHLYEGGETPCVHHTFCHAKTLASCLANGLDDSSGIGEPEGKDWLYAFPSAAAHVGRCGAWRITASANDGVRDKKHHCGGGMLSLAWHDAIGLIFAGSVSSYTLDEPNNMLLHKTPFRSNIPRVEIGAFHSAADGHAHYTVTRESGEMLISAQGRLTDDRGGIFPGYSYRMSYHLDRDMLTLTTRVDGASYPVIWHLPFVVTPGSTIKRGTEAWEKQYASRAVLGIYASHELCDMGTFFFHTPGLFYHDLAATLFPGETASIQLRIDTSRSRRKIAQG